MYRGGLKPRHGMFGEWKTPLRTAAGGAAIVTLQAGAVAHHLELLALLTGVPFITLLAGDLQSGQGQRFALQLHLMGHAAVAMPMTMCVAMSIPAVVTVSHRQMLG